MAFGGVSKDDFSFDVPMPGETFLSPPSKIRSFLLRCGIGPLAGLSGVRPPPTGWLVPLIESSRLGAEALVPELADVDWIMVCGRGPQYGIALEASLKIAEIAGIPSAAFPWEEALHGRLHGLTARSLALFIATTPEAISAAAIVIARNA